MIPRFFLAVALVLSQPLSAQDIVVLGEVHDNPEAHQGQARVVLEMAPTAVVFEMLTDTQAQRANAERSRINDIWNEGNWPHYSLYAPILKLSVTR